jgi:hypothetical protein
VALAIPLQVCAALAQVAKHSVDLAEVVVEAEVFPKCLTCLKYPDDTVRKAAATLVREVGAGDMAWCKGMHAVALVQLHCSVAALTVGQRAAASLSCVPTWHACVSAEMPAVACKQQQGTAA